MLNMKIFNSPQLIETNSSKSIFLAGTIEMGNSENWQKRVITHFESSSFNIYNPRREEWDHSWVEKIDNREFRQQVDWELTALEKADLVLFNFLPGSKSPVSLLELGLCAKSGKAVVCCPTDYWKRGNVQIVCAKYKIPLYYNLADLLKSIY